MITSLDFPRLQYRNPEKAIKDKRSCIDKIIGLDSEAYTTGEPFMFCTSLHRVHRPDEIPYIFFKDADYVNGNFMLYNIKYDSGAILYHLPRSNLHELWSTGKTKFGEYRYSYIPHKLLRISRGKRKASFWDIAQFYRLSLDNAARKYLNKKKIDIRTKRFSKAYVQHFWNYIAKYCIQDAVLTEELGNYFINKLMQLNIIPSTLYSQASISFKFFASRTNIVTSWRFWNEDRALLEFACDAYEGGKFEVTTRGKLNAKEYDITSAYPYYIRNLIDIKNATYIRTSEYQPKAVYGFLRVHIDNTDFKYLPCGIMVKNVRIYPAGSYYLTITKEEYDYLQEISVPVKIIDAMWLFVKRRRYPYRKPIDEAFKIKSESKNKDAMMYHNSKIIMNGFYGKTAQVIELPDKKLVAGAGWNPVYASVITANTRIQVSRIQNLFKGKCYAVHTDSVMIDRNLSLPDNIPSDGSLGNFEYVTEGESILIACGMYQIGKDCAFKGFRPQDHETWESLLSKKLTRKKLRYKIRHVESWIETMAKNHPKDKINLFQTVYKDIDFNCDVKRIWKTSFTGRDLLTRSETSLPKIHVEILPPKHWGVS